ncbi:MAG: hypothetical protein WCI11_05625 [Candidatus Methylumidiphilus sp.]
MVNMILGIHSNIAGDDNDYTGGHAWLTITESGKTSFYGLWPDAHPRVVDNGDDSDIRNGLEASAKAVASRYYKLSDAQAKQFNALMKANVAWRYTNTCASWASEIVYEVVGEDVDADDYMGFETPRELGRNILLLEKTDPTTVYASKGLEKNPASSFMSRGG